MTELEKREYYWKNDPYFDEETRASLARIKDEKELFDVFYRDLEFGTAGMRGVMGAGPNRMNKYVVRRATRGFALYLKERFPDAGKRGVVIAYDTRNGSRAFAEETALMLCADGIKALLFGAPSPVPLLSFTVRHRKAAGGVAITASHNPKEYNGYKVYDETGCQLLPEGAAEVARAAEAINDFSALVPMKREKALSSGLLEILGDEAQNAFCAAVMTQARGLTEKERAALSVVYTPLHGSGREPVLKVLKGSGFKVCVVPEQEMPDGDFPTVPTPNPEDKKALSLGIALAEEKGADIVVGTDPDCDRVGVAVLDGGEYKTLTGNQTGALLTYYLLCRGSDADIRDSVLIKSVVTGEMGAVIARSRGVRVLNVLTGFKYIGELMNRFEKTGERFLIGYEESCGYLVGTHARDKDGVLASMLICEAAAYFAARGKNLCAVLRELFDRYGYFLDAVDSFTFKGADGAEKIKGIMRALREKGASLVPGIERAVDYSSGTDGLPPADLLRLVFSDGSFMAARPSGTEPKIKIYYSLCAKDEGSASRRLSCLRRTVGEYIK